MTDGPRYNRRHVDRLAVPAPMRVRDEVIERCRLEVEGRTKARLRTLLLPLASFWLAPQEVGEGYHWALTSRIRGARIGRFAYVGPGSDLSGPVVIGDLTMVSRNVTLFGDDHVHDDPSTPMRIAFPGTPRPVTIIEADCWIGQNAQLREGVRVRRGSVVAAGAIVTKDTLPYSIVAGVSARHKGYRFSPADQAAHDRLLYSDSIDRPAPAGDNGIQ